MNDTRLLPDDPRLTAYALGELAGDERATVEAALRQNPALRAIVDEIRAATAQLEAALAAEVAGSAETQPPRIADVVALENRATTPSPVISPPSRVRRRMVVIGEDEQTSEKDDYSRVARRSSLLRFPGFYYVAGSLAAACFAVLVAFYERPAPAFVRAPRAERRTVERIALASAETKPAETLDSATPANEPIEPTTPVTRVADAVATTEAASASTSDVAVNIDAATAAVSPAVMTSANRTHPATAFIRSDLSLAAQAKGELADRVVQVGAVETRVASRARSDGVSAGSSILPASPALLALSKEHAATTAPQSSETAIGLESADNVSRETPTEALAVGGSRATASERISFNAPAQVVAEPNVGRGRMAGIVPGTTPFSGNRSITATPGSGETVMLSAFMVASDRARGFAVNSAGHDPVSGARELSTREILPFPPPGAKFGRNAEAYSPVRDNEFVRARVEPRSTFSIDVDTASYANVRRIIEHGSLPARDAVRIEELLNYFPYRYPAPKEDPIAATLEVADAPWAPKHRLVRIGLKAREVPLVQRAPANLVFLVDVSSSMNQVNKLPLVKQSLRLLISRLRPEDRIAIVTYAGSSGLALASTPVAQSREILHALDALAPNGPANGAMGIRLAYDIARSNFVNDGVNRVVLCTDGDFDVGITREDELVRFIEEKAQTGVFLTVLGFGMGNYKDATLEKLAQRGNGNYGYIDTRREAEKLLVEQIDGTLVTVAKDVKVEVDFNPAKVARYRLIGYENRLLRKEDFNTDQVDAGEIGSGQTVTALYEIVPVGAEPPVAENADALSESAYAVSGAASSRLAMPDGTRDALSNELLTVRVRYKKPDSFFSFGRMLEIPLVDTPGSFAQASADFRFAAAVAQFGMLLRGSSHRGSATIGDIATWATAAVASPADDPGGFRAEFIELVRKTKVLME